MIIQKMNNVLVKHSKVLFSIFTIIIIVSFVWFFMPGVDGSLLFGSRQSASAKAGSVFDEKITFGDIQKAMTSIVLVESAEYGIYPSMHPEVKEDQAFQFAALLKASEKLGFTISDKEVSNYITNFVRTFQKDGKFSKDAYEHYRTRALAPSGYGYKDFESAVADVLLVRKLINGASADTVLTDGEFAEGIDEKLEKTTFRTVTFDPADYADDAKVTDEEIKAYYDANGGKFLTLPESDVIIATAFTKDVAPDAVSETQAKEYYEMNKDNYTRNGKIAPFEQVSKEIISQLGSAQATEKAANKVRAFIKTMRQLERAPEFVGNEEKIFRDEAAKAGLTVTEAKSVTSASKPDAKISLSEGIIKSVSTLEEVKGMTNLAKSKDYASVAMLTARKAAVQASFDDVKADVEKALRSEKASALVPEKSGAFVLALEDSSDRVKDLETLAKKFEATVSEPQERARIQIETLGRFSPSLPGMILNTKAGTLSKFEGGGTGAAMAVFVVKRTPATEQEKSEYSEVVRGVLLEEKRSAERAAFMNWIFANVTKNYRSGNEKAE